MRWVQSGQPLRHLPRDATKYGNQINLDMTKFRECIDTKKYYAAVQKDIADANALGINATPGLGGFPYAI